MILSFFSATNYFAHNSKWCMLFICLLLAGTTKAACNAGADTSRSKIKTKKSLIISSNNSDTSWRKKCEHLDVICTVIEEAIDVGAPTYNDGNIIGCYRIYEGAAYKILYKYGSKCKEVRKILETALEKSYGDYSASDKAWIMRMAFDTILGVPTVTTAK